jgi:hypothetical protein
MHGIVYRVWNECGMSMRDENTVERSVRIEAGWFTVLLAEMPSGSVTSQRRCCNLVETVKDL